MHTEMNKNLTVCKFILQKQNENVSSIFYTDSNTKRNARHEFMNLEKQEAIFTKILNSEFALKCYH